MAKLTKEQIQKINNNCRNGWGLDLRHFMFHNEKTLFKNIDLDDEHYINFKLEYNYNNQITLYFNKFYHKTGEDYATSTGLGKSRILDKTQATRKNLNNLIELTDQLTDDKLMQINNETDVIRTPIFVATEEF